MLNAAPLPAVLSFSGLQMDTPVLMVSPEEEYAAIFSCAGAAMLLQSDCGRRVRVGPLRSFGGEDPVEMAVSALTRKGFLIQDVDNDNVVDFLEKFMSVAGFTAGHIQASLSLCLR